MKQTPLVRRISLLFSVFPAGVFVACALAIASLVGCHTTPSASEPDFGSLTNNEPAQRESIILREGDTIQITFPGAPPLNATRTIRRDGKIDMQLVPGGEVTAAGLTPRELEKKLVELYSSQLVEKEVIVTVISSTFPVFVTGAVIHPGEINSDRPITALDAIMKAGGFDEVRANKKAVTIIRNVNGRMEHNTINLDAVLKGKSSKAFYLKPSDIVNVPERFQLF